MMEKHQIKQEQMITQDKIRFRKYCEYISERQQELRVRNKLREMIGL